MSTILDQSCIDKLLCFIESEELIVEVSKACCKKECTLKDKISLRKAVELHLRKNGVVFRCNVVPGEYDSREILIELISETIMDGIKSGISAHDVAMLTAMFLKLLQKIKSYDDMISEEKLAHNLKAILLESANSFSRRGLLMTVEYLSSMVLRNCRLYSYLLLEEQEIDRSSDCIEISTMPESLDLSSGCLADEWEKRQRLLQRETEFNKNKLHIAKVKEQIAKEDAGLEQTRDSVFDHLISVPAAEESLNKAVTIVTQIEADVLAKDLLVKVRDNEMNLEFEIDKLNIKKK